MSKAELLRRLNQAHRETLVLVQQFSKDDFAKKAPGALWTALDLFAHLASWNRDARQALSDGTPFTACRGMPAGTEARTVQKVMEEFRQALESLAGAFQRTPANREADAILEHAIRHYQTHQNDLNILIASFRPH